MWDDIRRWGMLSETKLKVMSGLITLRVRGRGTLWVTPDMTISHVPQKGEESS